ncbi:hypothetical protein RRG08_033722 [Elysia crispata]|uniref:Uncharacterized protein n=1 Tax=Elysia crispata TaxID=231223 RepID=A0AAE1DV44_9GAST|nr:hypothetical protein RRG08_033722 [Elysia crispata]
MHESDGEETRGLWNTVLVWSRASWNDFWALQLRAAELEGKLALVEIRPTLPKCVFVRLSLCTIPGYLQRSNTLMSCTALVIRRDLMLLSLEQFSSPPWRSNASAGFV